MWPVVFSAANAWCSGTTRPAGAICFDFPRRRLAEWINQLSSSENNISSAGCSAVQPMCCISVFIETLQCAMHTSRAVAICVCVCASLRRRNYYWIFYAKPSARPTERAVSIPIPISVVILNWNRLKSSRAQNLNRNCEYLSCCRKTLTEKLCAVQMVIELVFAWESVRESTRKSRFVANE